MVVDGPALDSTIRDPWFCKPVGWAICKPASPALLFHFVRHWVALAVQKICLKGLKFDLLGLSPDHTLIIPASSCG